MTALPTVVHPPAVVGSGRRGHGATILVLVVGLLVTAVLTVVAWEARDRNEDRLLDQRVREAGVVLQSSIPRLQTPLASAAQLAEATNGDQQSFQQLMQPLVGREPQFPFVSASLWPLGSADPRPVAVVGEAPALQNTPRETIDGFLTRSANTPLMAVLDLLDQPEARLGYSFTSPRPPARYVAYAEAALPPDRRSVAQPGSAFADLDYALYLGMEATPDSLLIASTGELPLEGRQSSTTVAFGDAFLHLVMTPLGHLGGGLMDMLPWLIGLTGALVTVGATLFTDRLLRSRNHAEELAVELGRVAEENAGLYAEQRSVAQTLQENLLPQQLPALAGLEIGVRYESGVDSLEVGGDWYDVIETGDGRAVFVVGDVSGRGLPAAAVMASLRHAIRAYAMQGDGPATILTKLARLVSVAEDGHFATVLCGSLDLARREVVLANAGHPRPLMIDGTGTGFVATEVGVPVGTAPQPTYRQATMTVPPRATLLLYTDGLFERRGETVDAGLERLRQLATPGDLVLDVRLDRVLDGLAAGRGSDDTAILGLRWLS